MKISGNALGLAVAPGLNGVVVRWLAQTSWHRAVLTSLLLTIIGLGFQILGAHLTRTRCDGCGLVLEGRPTRTICADCLDAEDMARAAGGPT